jgi:GntR family transcriptional repressor for pyruvate dehydrogenase complex
MKKNNKNSKQNLFNPVKPRRAFEEICDEIKRLIFKGILKPGDQLPSELDLASQFNVSRQTVREALRLLEITGFIRMQKGGPKGPLIVDTILNTISSSYLDAFQMKKITIDELVAARIEIEKMVLRAVLSGRENYDIQLLEKNVARAKSLLKKRINAFGENMQFHKMLAKASKNYVFVIMVESLLTVTADIRSRLGFGLELSEEAAQAHDEIVQAIKRGEYEEAIGLMERHLVENAHLLKEALARYATKEEAFHKNPSSPAFLING